MILDDIRLHYNTYGWEKQNYLKEILDAFAVRNNY